MPAKKPPVRYNAFTKSYKLGYIVHAANRNEDKTLCGRNVEKPSNVKFDEDVEGACKKCLQKLDIERRIHPGFE